MAATGDTRGPGGQTYDEQRAAQFGQLIRLWRERILGLSIEDVTQRTERLSPANLRNIEKGRSGSMRGITLKAIEDAMRWRTGAATRAWHDPQDPSIRFSDDIGSDAAFFEMRDFMGLVRHGPAGNEIADGLLERYSLDEARTVLASALDALAAMDHALSVEDAGPEERQREDEAPSSPRRSKRA